MSVEFNKIEKIYTQSIFSQLGREMTQELLKRGRLETFSADRIFNTQLKTDEVYVLLSGAVHFVSRISGKKVEDIKIGRSLELDILYNKADEWRFDWYSTEESEFFVVSFKDFLEVIKVDHKLSAYLGLITRSVAIQRFKNDLRLLGGEPKNVIELISSLKTTDDLKTLANDTFILIDSGDVKVEFYFDNWHELSEFNETDYFVYYKDDLINYKTLGQCRFIYIQKKYLDNLFPEIMSYSFIEKVKGKVEEHLEALKGQEVVEESDFVIESEEDDPDITEFKLNNQKPPKGKRNAILQHDMMDCAAACMSMVSRFYGKKINIARWRNVIFVTREGASMLAIKNGVKQVGFDCIGARSGYKGLKNLVTPFISLMEYHYIVVYEVTDDYVDIADPAKGMLRISADEFKRSYSKNIALLKPNQQFYEFPESKPMSSKYWVLLEGSKHLIFDLLLISALIFLTTLTIPVFYQFIFDNILRSQSEVLLNIVAVSVIALNLLLGFSSHIRQRIIASLSSILNIKLTALFFRKILQLPLSYFIVRNVGDISSRFGELRKLTAFVSEKGVTFFVNVISIFSYGLVLFFYSSHFVILFLIIMLTCILVLFGLLKLVKVALQESFAIEGRTRSLVFEQFKAMSSLRTGYSIHSAFYRWREKFYTSLELRKRMDDYFALIQSFTIFMSQFSILVFILLAVYLYMQGELTLGQVVAVNALSQSLIMPLVALIKDWDDVNKVSVSLEKIDEIVTSPSEDYSIKKAHPLDGDIVFKDIWFRYGGENSPWIIKNLSLSVYQGQTVAFVGRSGSGKSTLSYLVNLLYVPTKGLVTINGKDNLDIDLKSIREQCAVILQESSIYDGTIIENICMGANVNMNRVRWACKVACVDEFLKELPEGLETTLTANNTKLSGGQKQRVNIARAIYSNPKILILDEATSALDPITEAKVVRNLQQECKNMTNIIIAHRFNTIMHSDKIFVLDSGKLHEAGTHQELIRMRGQYFKMFQNQIG